MDRSRRTARMVMIALGLFAAVAVTTAIAEYQKAHPTKEAPTASGRR